MDIVLLPVIGLKLCSLCTLVVLAVDGRLVLKIFTTVFLFKMRHVCKNGLALGLYLTKPTVFHFV
jgi:hypothetical protein